MPNKKFPSFAEYAKNNGGLERFMDNPKDRKEFAHREFMYDEAVAGIDFDFPLTVYRALELFEGEEVKFDGAGVWWTTSLDSADAYFGATSIWTPKGKPAQKSRIVTLTAQVLKEADVDWEKTLEANVINPDENEVTMRVGAQMRLIAIDGKSIQKRMITAAAEETVKPVVFKIEVPGDRRENFWNRPDGKMEFWAFKDRPRAFLEERIIFTFDGKPVAEAKVLKIEEPGTTACGATGQYRDHHKVFWNSTHFKKYASNGNVTLYHGTTWEKADSIQQQGLKASANEVTDGKKYVWCSTDEQEATWYGMSAASEAGDENRYAVVKFAWDWDKSEPDPEHAKFGEDPNVFRRIESDIPASAIRGVYYFRGEKRVKGTEKTAGGWIGPVFHGTIGNFAKLKGQPDAAGMTYFTDDAEYANNFTKNWMNYAENSAVYPAYVKFNKPFDARNWSEEKITPEDYAKAIGADLSEMKAQMPKFFQLLMDKGTGTWFWRYLLLLPHISKAALMKQGYDGIILMEAIDKYQSPDTTSFVVFKDSQIKPFFGPKGKPKNVIDLQGSEKTADHVNDEGFWAGEGNAASGVLPICPPKGTVCLAMRSSEVMTPNCWGTLGGAVQRGMSPQDSAKTEMAEETGFHGGIRLIPAFVFSAGGGFKYHNFIGVVQAEFGFNPSEEHSWETDYIRWLPYAEIVADMQKNPGNYHPGLLKLFSESRDKIEKALGLENKTASKPELTEELLMEIAWKVRDKMFPDRDAQDGDCEGVSDAIVDELHKRGWGDAHIVYGQWRGLPKHPHVWVRVGEWEVDATQDQFAAYDDAENSPLLDTPVLVKRGSDDVIKLKPKNPKLDSFMHDFNGGTIANPLSHKDRVWNNKVLLEVRPFDGKIHVSDIMSLERGERNASRALDWLCSLADKHAVAMSLTPSAFGDGKGLNDEQLSSWYARRGFKPDRGTSMVREPKTTMTAAANDLKKLIKMHDTIKELPGRLRTRETRDAESVSRIQQDKLTRLADAIEKSLPKASRGHLAQARRALEDADVAYHNYQNSREPDFDGDEELSHVLNYQETALMILHQILREAERGKTASDLQFRDEMRGAHHGQNDMTLFAEVGGRTVGYLEYAVYQGESSVQWLEVSDKRKGYGTALLKKLQSMYPDTEVNLGMTTEDGTALVDKMKFEEKPTEHAEKFKELDSLKPEKDRLEAVAESYYAVESHTEEENKAFMSDMEKLNEINDRVWELEQELHSKSPSKRLIAAKKGNTATWNGKPFWSGAVSVLDGQIEEVHSYKEAEEVDFHHSFYFSPESQELMRSEESAFFCVYSDGSILVNATGRNKLSEDQKRGLEQRVRQQIVIGVKEKKADQQHLFPDSQDARFQQWFNGSKVVDADGRPLPVYHGTRSSVDFDAFSVDGPPADDSDYESQPTSSGSGADPTALMGAHFAVEPRVANQFAEGKGWTGTRYEGEQPKPRVMKVFLRITNPKDFGSEHNLREFINQGKIHGDAVDLAMRNDLGVDEFEEDDADGSMQKWYDKYDSDTAFRVEQNTYLFEQHRRAEGDDSVLDEAAYDLASQARGRLETAGHDGIHYKNVVEGGTAWIAFDPRQVKSAWAQSFNPFDPRFTASKNAEWIKSAAGFAFKSFKKLWHVGTLNVKDKGSDSLEGAGLSVSVNPEEWQEIAHLGGDLWEFAKNGNKFVNFHRITPAQKKAITEWGVQNGLVLSATVWQVTYWDDEAEEERHFNMDTEQEAKAEASEFEGAKIRPMNNKLLGTEKLVQRSNNPSAKNTALAFDLLVTVYAEDVLDCDGVWWQDTLDPLNLSAPRGVIFPAKLPSWSKRKLSENDNGVLEFSTVASVEPDSIDTDPEVEFERTYKYVKTLGWRGMNPWYPEKYPWTALRVLSQGWELKDEMNNKLIAKGSDLESLKMTLAKYDLNKLRSEAPSKTIDAEPVQKKLNA